MTDAAPSFIKIICTSQKDFSTYTIFTGYAKVLLYMQ